MTQDKKDTIQTPEHNHSHGPHEHHHEGHKVCEHTHEDMHPDHTHGSDHHSHDQEPHTHVLEDGTIVTHTHGDHGHYHANTKAVLNRMSRAIGHMESIKSMIESGRDCSEVLIQIAAVRSAINNIGKVILEDHIDHCIVDAVEHGDKKALEDLNEAINKFVK